jgi:hypothetical protein
MSAIYVSRPFGATEVSFDLATRKQCRFTPLQIGDLPCLELGPGPCKPRQGADVAATLQIVLVHVVTFTAAPYASAEIARFRINPQHRLAAAITLQHVETEAL